MFKYVLKRIGYMFLVLFILSIVIFMIYNLTPSNRAYTDATVSYTHLPHGLLYPRRRRG